ncbi:hypothetical protein KJ782_00875 [Patescibacteria group bacterium]|nr:hypothetical protein [Patescibacteria group bacterium]
MMAAEETPRPQLRLIARGLDDEAGEQRGEADPQSLWISETFFSLFGINFVSPVLTWGWMGSGIIYILFNPGDPEKIARLQKEISSSLTADGCISRTNIQKGKTDGSTCFYLFF